MLGNNYGDFEFGGSLFMLLCLCGILAVEKLGLQGYDVSEVMVLLMEWH